MMKTAFHTFSVADAAMAPQVSGSRKLCENIHTVKMNSLKFVFKCQRISYPFTPENFAGMFEVFFFFIPDPDKQFARFAAQSMTHIVIHGDGKGFQHHFLNDKACSKILL